MFLCKFLQYVFSDNLVMKVSIFSLCSKAKCEGWIINYLWGGDRRHSHIFDGSFSLSDLWKDFDPLQDVRRDFILLFLKNAPYFSSPLPLSV